MHSQLVDRTPLLLIRELPSWRAPTSRVIDLGTGSGRHAIALAQRGYQVDAIDESPAAIERLQRVAESQQLPIHACVMNAHSPDIDFARYGVVLCTFVLHFLVTAEAIELLERARARAAPGTVHAIAAFTAQGEICAGSPDGYFFPEPGEIAAGYRARGWHVHRDYLEPRSTLARRADGTPKRNLASFVLAGN